MLCKSSFSNIPKSIEDKMYRNLHQQVNHPIEILKKFVLQFIEGYNKYKFTIFEKLDPVVSVKDNFDKLLIPDTHPARSKSDTYYVNENNVLRTHTSAHQNELLEKGYTSFIVIGPVFRKDEIDAKHYPVFHQMELLTLVDDNTDPVEELKTLLSELIHHLFPGCEYRFNPDYFPFTTDSMEVEVKYQGNWLEILGCGVVQSKILENNNIVGKKAIAFGLGFDRMAMILFNIPDIRYLWSTHSKFISQFEDGKIKQFVPYSELPSQYKDISFYIPEDRIKDSKWLDENEFFELARDTSNDLMEEVKLIDSFYNQKKNKHSRTYRIVYSPNNPDMKNGADFFTLTNNIQTHFRQFIVSNFHLELR